MGIRTCRWSACSLSVSHGQAEGHDPGHVDGYALFDTCVLSSQSSRSAALPVPSRYTRLRRIMRDRVSRYLSSLSYLFFFRGKPYVTVTLILAHVIKVAFLSDLQEVLTIVCLLSKSY